MKLELDTENNIFKFKIKDTQDFMVGLSGLLCFFLQNLNTDERKIFLKEISEAVLLATQKTEEKDVKE